MDVILFEITWSGAQDARLYYLIDNDHLVLKKDSPHPQSVTIERGKISIKYEVTKRPAHHIEWSLMFPGKTLSGLKARAVLNSDDPKTQSAQGDLKHHWVETLDV